MIELQLKFKRLTDTMTVPTKAHDTDACFDLYADIPHSTVLGTTIEGMLDIPPHTCVLIPTGFATNIPHGYWAAVFARSGVATKKHLRPAQGVPVIDEPYTGEWFIPLHNDSDRTQIINHGDKIAQFVLLPYPKVELIEVDELDSTDRGSDGFGSSGR